MLTPEDYRVATRHAMEAGFDCVKVDPLLWSRRGGFQDWNTRGILTNEKLKTAVERVAAVREEGGDGLDIIIELHAYTDTNTSVQLARAYPAAEPESVQHYFEQDGHSPRQRRAHIQPLGLQTVLRKQEPFHHPAGCMQHRRYHRSKKDL